MIHAVKSIGPMNDSSVTAHRIAVETGVMSLALSVVIVPMET